MSKKIGEVKETIIAKKRGRKSKKDIEQNS
jgi:hypothetical protein